ncbi:MAG: gliding motility protein GldM [Flavobacteriaceae bacterium]|nr:gliding motility protein GldM [Flavobacteriaceae bacterium]
MASGKLSPRQKMINLMYLVLIAMLALNMSKEVLTAFGIMNDKLENNNSAAIALNDGVMSNLQKKADEQPDQFRTILSRAENMTATSKKLYDFLDVTKADLLKKYKKDENGKLPYEIMDKGDKIDETWFQGDKITPVGKKFVNAVDKYRTDMLAHLGEDNKRIAEEIKSFFNTDKVKAKDGANKTWLDYNFKGFPIIASIAKMSSMQADIKSIENKILSSLLSGQQDIMLSFNNYEALVIPEKPAFFNGEKFKGKMILARTDESTKPNKVILNGEELSPETFKRGGVVLEFPAGSVGEQKLEGEFVFLENGKEIEVPIKSSYAVIPKPNSATIAADKMNVVYRGVDNPMTISFAGVSDNKVNATAPGLKRTGNGKYSMKPQKGRTVTIKVTGTLNDGTKVSDGAEFRIKGLPKPVGKARGQDGYTKMSKSGVQKATVSASFGDDFDFNLPLKVKSFKFKVPGQPTIECSGTKLNSRAKSALGRAKRGSTVTIFDIKCSAPSAPGVTVKEPSPVTIEITS